MESRTSQQNRALHKYFEMVAYALNDSGWDIPRTIRHYRLEIPWTKESVKTLLWKEIQKTMFAKPSTTQLDKLKEINEIVEVLTKFLGTMGVGYIPFPHDLAKEKY